MFKVGDMVELSEEYKQLPGCYAHDIFNSKGHRPLEVVKVSTMTNQKSLFYVMSSVEVGGTDRLLDLYSKEIQLATPRVVIPQPKIPETVVRNGEISHV